MIIGKKIKNQKKKTHHNFYKYYFFITVTLASLAILIFLNLGIWENYKKNFFYKIHSNGIINYKYLPQMLIHALKKNFYSYEAIYVHLNQRNKIILEKNRLDKINYVNSPYTPTKEADYGYVDFVSANASITSKNKIIKTNIRLKGDRGIHYKDIKNSSYKFT